jgi:hypothetical protein
MMTVFIRWAALIVLSLVLPAVALCQTPVSDSPQKITEKKAGPPNGLTDVDEAFELNIDERRIVRRDFSAATGVTTGNGSRNLDLQIGVALQAGSIQVLLRNVRGTVRFRGSLQRVLDLVDAHTPAP